MRKALLVGNGLTANLIPEYSNEHMMSNLKCSEPEIYEKANSLFEPFRKKVTSARLASVGWGYSGDDSYSGSPSLAQPITGLLYNEDLMGHIKDTLENFGLSGNGGTEYLHYFVDYGLVFETQYRKISSIESLLKVMTIFEKIGRFSKEDLKNITSLSNRIYFNHGDNRLANICKSVHEPLKEWLNQYSYIFTTNYDCVLDDACAEKKDIYHLHGGFHYKDMYTVKKNTHLAPEEACLIWGINGEDKRAQMHGGITFPITFPLEFPESLFDKYIRLLRTLDIFSIDIFGYSGENDQHINDAISGNKSIEVINYYCNPKDTYSEVLRFELTEKFRIPSDKRLFLISWNEVWDKLR